VRTIDLPAHGPGRSAPLAPVGFRPGGQRPAASPWDGTAIVRDTGDPSRPPRRPGCATAARSAADRTAEAGGPRGHSRPRTPGNLVDAVTAPGSEAPAGASREHTVKTGGRPACPASARAPGRPTGTTPRPPSRWAASGRIRPGGSRMPRPTGGTVAVTGPDGRILLAGHDTAGRPAARCSPHPGELLTASTATAATASTTESRAA
jgi:hypothetical protein